MKATLIKVMPLLQHTGVKEQRVYRLDPPLKDYGGQNAHELVLTSAANVMFSGPETYIFPCDLEGEVTNWGELPGSKRGTLDCAGVLRDLGYEIEGGAK